MHACLTVELVPSTCWYTNVRSNVPKAVWDRLRRRVAAEAGQRCEICGGRGRRWPVECLESGTTTTPPSSASSGWWRSAPPATRSGGRLDAVIDHLATVNGWSPEDAALYLEVAFEPWAARSRYQWTLDISVLGTRYGVDGLEE